MRQPTLTRAESRAVKAAVAAIGGLSSPSKMPCHGYSIPAQACKVGSLLRNVSGSACAHCYALSRLSVYSPGPFPAPQEGTTTLEGPHYPEPHRWYASAEVSNGTVIKVKG